MTPPRLRFAPSPTGFFHVGGARTALYNWLVARRTGGTFILRIEDTDAERNRPAWVEGIQSAMRWVGLDWDEGPYFQSANTARHVEAAQRLFDGGHAYYCECTRDTLDARTTVRSGSGPGPGSGPGYDQFCRDRGLPAGPGRALRFRTPHGGATTVVDLIRGEPVFENALIEDFVLLRSDGSPMFILANMFDDLESRVTHVVRGEEHLPNTPKYMMLWEALAPDVALPVFAHVPLLVNEKRQKLSKRRDRVAVEEYRDLGVLPEAMRNYLVLLGWSPKGDREIIPVEEMVDLFRLEDVNPSPAFFDLAKLTHMNGEYVRALPLDDFVDRCQPQLSAFAGYDRAAFSAIAPFVQERVKLLPDVVAQVDFLFVPEPTVDAASWDKAMAGDDAVKLLDGFLESVADTIWRADDLKGLVERVGAAHGLKLGKAQAPIRVAVTGRAVGPPLFEALEVLGRERTLDRVRAARARLE